jgi:anti-sigma B factor antagonist
MADNAKPTYLVDATRDPVLIRIEGRACFQNCRCLRDFFTEMSARGRTQFVLDFAQCASMDSTFLGTLAGVALELRKRPTPGSLVIRQAGPRNLELIQNLGLDKLLHVEADQPTPNGDCSALECAPEKNEVVNARLALEAHQNLIAADEANRARFQDVLVFLQKRVEQG